MFKRIILFIFLLSFIFSLAGFALAEEEVITCEGDNISSEIECGKSSVFNLPVSEFTLPIIVVAGLLDGVNPCAIGMMIMLLGYLIIFAKKKDKILKIGLTYIITVFVTYFLIGVLFYNFIDVLVSWDYYKDISRIIRWVLGILLIIAGLINIKDYFWYGKGFSLQIPKKQRFKLTKYVQKATIPAAIVLGAVVTIFELPCSLPLYVGTISLLYENLGRINVISYLLVYNFMFVLPLVVIFVLTLLGKRIAEMKEWQEKRQREMKLVMGIVLFVLGVVLFMI